MSIEDTDVSQVLEVLVVVQGVAYQHLVGHLEPNKVRSVALHSAPLL